MENRNSVGSQQLTVDATSGGVSLTVPIAATRALMSLQTAEIRFLDSGTAPTSTLGHVVVAGKTIEYLDANYISALAAFRAIRTGGTSGTLDITYYD